jgi:hypothetical protein
VMTESGKLPDVELADLWLNSNSLRTSQSIRAWATT